MKAIMIGVALCGLSGCMSTTGNLQRESARAIGNGTPDAVQVAHVQRGMTNVSWEAQVGGQWYHCAADDMLRRVACVRQGASNGR